MTRDLPTPTQPLKIGTRGSPLALAQAHETRRRLQAAFDLPEEAFEISVIKTTGDRVLDRPLKEIGGKGLFTREIEEALLSGDIDIAVHSMKDMPVLQPGGLTLDCYLPREDVRDAFVAPGATGLADLPEGARVGTSSLRRRAQVLVAYPHLEVVEFRGNVQTRLKKLEDGVAACTFLAMAGLNRLGRADVATAAIAPEVMLPAVAQGAIGIERREGDSRAAAMLEAIHDRPAPRGRACLSRGARRLLRDADRGARGDRGRHAAPARRDPAPRWRRAPRRGCHSPRRGRPGAWGTDGRAPAGRGGPRVLRLARLTGAAWIFCLDASTRLAYLAGGPAE
jgi:hydroxymethylbilane synthase